MADPRLLLSLPILALLATDLDAQRRRRAPIPKFENLTFATDRFESESLNGQSVDYGVFLPKGYEAEENAETRYPLMVWLHGMWEDHSRFASRGGGVVLDRMVGAGEFPEAIVVCPSAGRMSFYINAKANEDARYEDLIAKDVVEHATTTYRVAEGRQNRILGGVSMGGYGAIKIALKHPSTFGTVIAHSAAILPEDSSTLDEAFPWIKRYGGAQRALGTLFGNPLDTEMWAAENVLTRARNLSRDDLEGLKIYFDCGDEDRHNFQGPNAEFHEILREKKIPHTWNLVEGGQHGWDYTRTALEDSLGFVRAALTQKRGAAGLEGLLQPAGASGDGGGGGNPATTGGDESGNGKSGR